MKVRMLSEGLLLGLGVVLGQALGWLLVAACGLALLVEGYRWRKRRRPASSGEESGEARMRAVDAELAIAREEAAQVKALIAHADPVTKTMAKVAWADWRTKMAAYVGAVISRSAGARFAPEGREETVMALGEPVAVDPDIDADIALLDALAGDLTPQLVQGGMGELEDAARARREHEAASFLRYSDAAQ